MKYCITGGTGTDALSMVMAWDIKEENEETFNMDLDKLEEAIKAVIEEEKLIPKMVLSVDLFGLPAPYPKIERIAKRYGLKFLEDGAKCFGSILGGKRACSFGDAATTSFFLPSSLVATEMVERFLPMMRKQRNILN